MLVSPALIFSTWTGLCNLNSPGTTHSFQLGPQQRYPVHLMEITLSLLQAILSL